MTPPSSPSHTRIVSCSIRLLGVHLDTTQASTADAVARALERLADSLVTWHDAIVVGSAGHEVARPVEAPPVGHVKVTSGAITAGMLERLTASAQAATAQLASVAAELDHQSRDLRAGSLTEGVAASERTRLAERGEALAADVHRLLEAIAELGHLAGSERASGTTVAPRATTAVARAEQHLRRVADSTGCATH